MIALRRVLGAAAAILLAAVTLACGFLNPPKTEPASPAAVATNPATVTAARPAPPPFVAPAAPKAAPPAPVPPVQAQKPDAPKRTDPIRWVKVLSPHDAELGDIGPLNVQDPTDVFTLCEYTIQNVFEPDQLWILQRLGGGARTVFILDRLDDVSTYVTGRAIDLRGVFKVTRLARSGAGKTILVFEYATDDEKAKFGGVKRP